MADDPETDDDSILEGDRLLDAVGIVLVLAIVGALALVSLLVVGSGDGGSSIAPDAEWRLERLNDSHVRIVHAGGESVEASKLVVTADGRQRHPAWTAETLAEGEGGAFRATRARSVVRLWIEEGTERELLAEWSIS